MWLARLQLPTPGMLGQYRERPKYLSYCLPLAMFIGTLLGPRHSRGADAACRTLVGK